VPLKQNREAAATAIGPLMIRELGYQRRVLGVDILRCRQTGFE
jgi:hypothetical protein